MLPPGPTGYGDCPYSSFSSRAGNPYLIDLDILCEHGLLEEADLGELSRAQEGKVDFGMLYHVKWPVLRLAFRRFAESKRDVLPGCGSYRAFKKQHAEWLDPFATFMALKTRTVGVLGMSGSQLFAPGRRLQRLSCPAKPATRPRRSAFTSISSLPSGRRCA
jgi:4-alpha-glucanotransferase